VLENTDPTRTPARVRVSLHGQQGFIDPAPGMTVILSGHLSPPQAPVEPGGFDFRRFAWFGRLGAVGYTRTPVLAYAPADQSTAGVRLYQLRMRLSAAVQNSLPGEPGAFAAAIMTGDRSGMSQATVDDLRAANLAHLLAISGLHMGLLTGFVFAAMRFALAAIPWVGLRLPVKKVAAVASLATGVCYLALSGGGVATQRAFVMVAVMLVAVLFDRRAITLRAVAVAAIIVLTLRPESLAGPGFQMSFAATTALVAAFGQMRGRSGQDRRIPQYAWPILAVILSSAVAGLATAPVAAAHFNRIADYGLAANLLSVPLMGAVVVPAAVLTAILAPFGWAAAGLALMRPAIVWILTVAHWVAGMQGAVTPVITPQACVLPMLAAGMLWLILWQGRARLVGLIPAPLAFAIWSQATRPPVLIAETGRLVGVMTDAGRTLSKPRGDSFAARSWLENDGDGAGQEDASARPGLSGPKGRLMFRVGEKTVIHLSGRGALERLGEACQEAALVILARAAPRPAPCAVIDQEKLRVSGALALYSDAGKLRLVGARQQQGRRLWSDQ